MFKFVNCRTWKNQYYPFAKHTIELYPGLNVHIDKTKNVKYWTEEKNMVLEGIAIDKEGTVYDIYISCPGQEKRQSYTGIVAIQQK